MILVDVVRHRIINQQLAGTTFKSAYEIVRWMGAMQAQDYAMAKWAIGVRLPNSTDNDIDNAINKGEIVRMHMMRPTWHLVDAKDVRWMLELTTPHLIKSMKSRWKALGLTDKDFNRSNAVIEKSLARNNNMTRAELVTELNKNKIKPNSLQTIHLMFNAELNGIVCNGSLRGKQFTYSLLDIRIPLTKSLARPEALAELSNRYFASHGPATIQDFMWWSGLPAAEAKAGLEMVKSSLTCQKTADQIYWFPESLAVKPDIRTVYFLPAFDEFIISYKDRTASLSQKFFSHAITKNGIFRPVIVVNGQVVGTWSREIKNTRLILEHKFFRSSDKLKKHDVTQAIRPYEKFLGKKIFLMTKVIV